MKFTTLAISLFAVAGSTRAACPAEFPHSTVWGGWDLCCDYIGPNDVSTPPSSGDEATFKPCGVVHKETFSC